MSRAIHPRPEPSTPVTLEDAQSGGILLAGSRSAETRRSYASAMRTFTTWCQPRGYPSLPTPEVVATYIAHRAENVAHSTISRDIAAISAAHLDTAHPDPTAHHGVRQALRSVSRTLGTSPFRRATPLTTALMRRIIDAMDDLETLTGKRDRAILLLGLAAAQRRGEIAALTTNDFTHHNTGLLLQIRRSKTDQTGRGDVIGIPRGADPETCPVNALQEWLDTSGRTQGDSRPLFSRIYNHARVAETRLSDRSIARIIQARAAAAAISGAYSTGGADLGLRAFPARRARDLRRRRWVRPDGYRTHHQASPTGLACHVRAPRQRARRLDRRQDRPVDAPGPGTS